MKNIRGNRFRAGADLPGCGNAGWRARWRRLVLGAVAASANLALGGCASRSGGGSLADLEHRDPLRRTLAVLAAGQSGDVSAAPVLVDRLEDEDPAVRAAAEPALQRLLGKRMIECRPGESRFAWAERFRASLLQDDRGMHESGHHVD